MITATSTTASACVHDTSGGRPMTRLSTGWIAQPPTRPTTAHAVSARAEVGWREPRGSGGSDESAGPRGVMRGPRDVVRRSAAAEQDVVGSFSIDLERDVVALADTRRVGRGEQLGDRPAVGEDGVGLEVVPRLEDEGALVGPRVRQAQEVLVGPAVADDDQVDVERAGGVADVAALAVEGVLDGQGALHEARRGERGVGEQDRVEERTGALGCVDGVYFTPLVGVLFTFPSRYLFAIGR